MRIALVCESFAARSGGAAQWQRGIARGLAARGHEVVVQTFTAPTERAADGDPAEPRDVVVRRLPWHPSRVARARAMTAALAASNADVVHDTGVGWSFDVFHPQMGPRLANYRRDMASRTAQERVRERVRPRHWRWLAELYHVERHQFGCRDALFVAVSSMVASSMERLYGVRPERLRIVPNAADPIALVAPDPGRRDALRRRLGVDEDRTLFLFAAHNPRLKGVRPLLDAASLLRAWGTRFKLVLIGADPDADLRRRIAELMLAGEVATCGFVPDASGYHAAADVVVLPTYHDACSLTVFEACAYGVPVITSRYDGASEHLTSGREGFVVDEPDDVELLACRMRELTDPALRRRMSIDARALARRHDLERNVVGLESVLHEAAQRRASGCGLVPRRLAPREHVR